MDFEISSLPIDMSGNDVKRETIVDKCLDEIQSLPVLVTERLTENEIAILKKIPLIVFQKLEEDMKAGTHRYISDYYSELEILSERDERYKYILKLLRTAFKLTDYIEFIDMLHIDEEYIDLFTEDEIRLSRPKPFETYQKLVTKTITSDRQGELNMHLKFTELNKAFNLLLNPRYAYEHNNRYNKRPKTLRHLFINNRMDYKKGFSYEDIPNKRQYYILDDYKFVEFIMKKYVHHNYTEIFTWEDVDKLYEQKYQSEIEPECIKPIIAVAMANFTRALGYIDILEHRVKSRNLRYKKTLRHMIRNFLKSVQNLDKQVEKSILTGSDLSLLRLAYNASIEEALYFGEYDEIVYNRYKNREPLASIIRNLVENEKMVERFKCNYYAISDDYTLIGKLPNVVFTYMNDKLIENIRSYWRAMH